MKICYTHRFIKDKGTSDCEHFEDIEWIFLASSQKAWKMWTLHNNCSVEWNVWLVPQKAILGTPRVEMCFSFTTMTSFLQTAIYSSGSVSWSPLRPCHWPSIASYLLATRHLCSASRYIGLCTRPSVLRSSLCWDQTSTWLTFLPVHSPLFSSLISSNHSPHTDTFVFQKDDQKGRTQIFYSLIKKLIPKHIQMVNFACDVWHMGISRVC